MIVNQKLDATLPKQRRKRWLILFSIFFATALAIMYLNISMIDALTGTPKFISFFLASFLPPKFINVDLAVYAIVETVAYAWIATFLSSVASLFLSLLISAHTTKIKTIRVFSRGLSAILRNIHLIIWLPILIGFFGLGSHAAIAALFIITIGFLSKGYAESIDDIPQLQLEGLNALGGSSLHVFFHGVLPVMFPAWVNWTLLLFEINIRSSIVVGLVGGGGIGMLIEEKIELALYQEAMGMIILVVLLIFFTEYITSLIRRKVR